MGVGDRVLVGVAVMVEVFVLVGEGVKVQVNPPQLPEGWTAAKRNTSGDCQLMAISLEA